MSGIKNPVKTETTRQKLLEASYDLFSKKNIESVSMEQAAKAAGYGVATMYRYYSSKPKLAVAVAAWKTAQAWEENRRNGPNADFSNMTAAGVLEYFLDFFLTLYRNRKDLLRFNQFFNIYVQSEKIDEATISPYGELIRMLAVRFHIIYEKAALDRTVRTDVPEEEMFRTTLHLMLAAVTRYAVGLVYRPDNDEAALKELETLKRSLLREYTGSSE